MFRSQNTLKFFLIFFFSPFCPPFDSDPLSPHRRNLLPSFFSYFPFTTVPTLTYAAPTNFILFSPPQLKKSTGPSLGASCPPRHFFPPLFKILSVLVSVFFLKLSCALLPSLPLAKETEPPLNISNFLLLIPFTLPPPRSPGLFGRR